MKEAVCRMNQASGYNDERYEWIDGTKIGFDMTGRFKGVALGMDGTNEIYLT